MRWIIAVLVVATFGVYAAERPWRWKHSMSRDVLGRLYRTEMTEATFVGVPSFNPMRDPLPLDMPTAGQIALDWITNHFEGQPVWLDEPEWQVRSIELREIQGMYWVYVVGCNLGLRGSDATLGESFAAVILANGNVVEPSVVTRYDPPDYMVAPPPRVALDEDDDRLISLNFRAAPLKHVLEFYADLTGWDITIEDRVSAVITMRPGRRLSPAEAVEMVEDVMRTKGIVLEQESDSELIARRWRARQPSPVSR